MASLLLLLLPTVGGAQQVRGRLVSARDSTPVGDALILLLDSTRHEVARTASTASGGFALAAPRPGRYTVRVQRIGYLAWETTSPPLAAGVEWGATLVVSDEAYSLPELAVYAEQPLCGVAMGNADLVAKLLESAQTALGLAEAAISSDDSTGTKYVVRSWTQMVQPDGTPFTYTPSLALDQLSGWPIRSADPESLRTFGFVRGEYPPARDAVAGSTGGPVYYGPDARVMFTPWFLDAHCYRIDKPRFEGDTTLVVRFKPARKSGRATLSGRFEFDRASLELRLLVFEFTHVPGWVPAGTGGAIRFVRLDAGGWVPAWWRMRAPVPTVNARKRTYEFYGYLEAGGYTVTVLRPGRKDDDSARRALQAARDLGPPPP